MIHVDLSTASYIGPVATDEEVLASSARLPTVLAGRERLHPLRRRAPHPWRLRKSGVAFPAASLDRPRCSCESVPCGRSRRRSIRTGSLWRSVPPPRRLGGAPRRRNGRHHAARSQVARLLRRCHKAARRILVAPTAAPIHQPGRRDRAGATPKCLSAVLHSGIGQRRVAAANTGAGAASIPGRLRRPNRSGS